MDLYNRLDKDLCPMPKKTDGVVDRYLKDHNHVSNNVRKTLNSMLIVIGRRSLTRGLHLYDEAFLQSYDYRLDSECKYLEEILQALIEVYERENKKEAKPFMHMFLIEHFPKSIHKLIAGNNQVLEELKRNNFNLAVLNPETISIECI